MAQPGRCVCLWEGNEWGRRSCRLPLASYGNNDSAVALRDFAHRDPRDFLARRSVDGRNQIPRNSRCKVLPSGVKVIQSGTLPVFT